MGKELSLNILEIAKKVQKLESAGLPDTYPATQVMMTGGGNVEEAVDDATPRTATGTTIADLVSAVNRLTQIQKSSAVIKVNDTVFLRRGYENQFFFQQTGIDDSATVVIEYNLRVDSSVFYKHMVNVTTPGRTSTPITIESWILYYFGAPIS